MTHLVPTHVWNREGRKRGSNLRFLNPTLEWELGGDTSRWIVAPAMLP